MCARFALIVSGLLVSFASAAEPFDYFQNSWSVIGLKDYKDGTRITPDNELILAGKRKIRIRYGLDLKPLSRAQTKVLQDGWLPIVNIEATDSGVWYRFTFWATPLPTVNDWRKAFDGPCEGEDYLNWVLVTTSPQDPNGTRGRFRIETITGDKIEGETQEIAIEPYAAAERYTAYRIPFSTGRPELVSLQADPRNGLEAVLWRDRTAEYWKDTLAAGSQIAVPCIKATQALWAAHVCQLIAGDGGALKGGENFYDEFYIRDGAYQIMEIEEAGLWDVARRAIEPFLQAQRPDGRFESQKGQLDANGQALWALWQYYLITGDRAFLERVYPQMLKAIEWLKQARRKAAADSPFAGLLPNALADGEYLWDGKYHIVGYDLWNFRGLLCTADAARALGKSEDAAKLDDEARQYRAAIDAACKRTGINYFPPSWEGAGTFWGNTETLWPTEVFSPDDPRVTATIEFGRRLLGGGFIEGTIRWLGMPDAIHPYMGAYTTMADLARGNGEQVVEDFYWYLLHSSAAQAFPEGIFYKRRFAWNDTIPHATGASNYAIMLRHMLVHEGKVETPTSRKVETAIEFAAQTREKGELHLLAGVPDAWLADGQVIHIHHAPTHFGELNLRIAGRPDGVEIAYDPPKRQPPAWTVLHLPASRSNVNWIPWTDPGRLTLSDSGVGFVNETQPARVIVLPGVEKGERQPGAGVEIAIRPDQKVRWEFRKVVEIYSKTAPPIKVETPKP